MIEGLIHLSIIMGFVTCLTALLSYFWSKIMFDDISKQIVEHEEIYFSTKAEKILDKKQRDEFLHSWDIPRGFA